MNELAPKNNVAEGKPRPSLLPLDVYIKYVCPAYEEGVIKYETESWRKGFPVSVMFDALQRHITAFFYKGEDIDKDAYETTGIKKHHLGAAMFCLASILHTLETKPELDDRPVKRTQLVKEFKPGGAQWIETERGKTWKS